MESHGKTPWDFVNDPVRGMIKNDSTTSIDRGFLYIGINKIRFEGIELYSLLILLELRMSLDRKRER